MGLRRIRIRAPRDAGVVSACLARYGDARARLQALSTRTFPPNRACPWDGHAQFCGISTRTRGLPEAARTHDNRGIAEFVIVELQV
jgi:hypothetical protein